MCFSPYFDCVLNVFAIACKSKYISTKRWQHIFVLLISMKMHQILKSFITVEMSPQANEWRNARKMHFNPWLYSLSHIKSSLDYYRFFLFQPTLFLGFSPIFAKNIATPFHLCAIDFTLPFWFTLIFHKDFINFCIWSLTFSMNGFDLWIS